MYDENGYLLIDPKVAREKKPHLPTNNTTLVLETEASRKEKLDSNTPSPVPPLKKPTPTSSEKLLVIPSLSLHEEILDDPLVERLASEIQRIAFASVIDDDPTAVDEFSVQAVAPLKKLLQPNNLYMVTTVGALVANTLPGDETRLMSPGHMMDLCLVPSRKLLGHAKDSTWLPGIKRFFTMQHHWVFLMTEKEILERPRPVDYTKEFQDAIADFNELPNISQRIPGLPEKYTEHLTPARTTDARRLFYQTICALLIHYQQGFSVTPAAGIPDFTQLIQSLDEYSKHLYNVYLLADYSLVTVSESNLPQPTFTDPAKGLENEAYLLYQNYRLQYIKPYKYEVYVNMKPLIDKATFMNSVRTRAKMSNEKLLNRVVAFLLDPYYYRMNWDDVFLDLIQLHRAKALLKAMPMLRRVLSVTVYENSVFFAKASRTLADQTSFSSPEQVKVLQNHASNEVILVVKQQSTETPKLQNGQKAVHASLYLPDDIVEIRVSSEALQEHFKNGMVHPLLAGKPVYLDRELISEPPKEKKKK